MSPGKGRFGRVDPIHNTTEAPSSLRWYVAGSLHRSRLQLLNEILVYLLATVASTQCAIQPSVDVVTDETNRTVAEQHVHAFGVRTGRGQEPVMRPVATDEARLLVRSAHVVIGIRCEHESPCPRTTTLERASGIR